MPFTRRALIRDTSLLAAGTLVGGGAAYIIEKLKKGRQFQPGFVRPRPKLTTYAGIRIIFAGSWLFHHEPTDSTPYPGHMRAVTMDLPNTSSPPMHIYPYGVWGNAPGNLDFNNSANPAYHIKIDGYKPSQKIKDLFGATVANYPFTYVQNPLDPTNNNKDAYAVKLDYSNRYCISIRLPIPDEIIPAAFVVGASIGNGHGHNELNTSADMYSEYGVPTVHIFDYRVSTSSSGLSFYYGDPSQPGNQRGTAKVGDHYYFHTEPKPKMTHTPVGMFKNLQDVLYYKNTSVLDAEPLIYTPASGGGLLLNPYAWPTDIDYTEFDAEQVDCGLYAHPYVTTASCTGGGFGLDCGCNECGC